MEEVVFNTDQLSGFVNEFCVGKDTETEQIIAGMAAVIEGNEFALAKMKNQKWFERIWFTITGKNKATVAEITQKRDVLTKFTIQLFIKMLDMLSNNSKVIVDLYRAVSMLSLTVDRTVTDLNNLAVKLNEKIISIDNYNNIITDIQNDKFDRNQPLTSLLDILSLVDERTMHDPEKLQRIKETMEKHGFQFDTHTRADELAEQIFLLSEEKVGRIYLFCQKISSKSCFLAYICRLIENYFYVSLTDRRVARQNNSAVNNAFDCAGIQSDSECFLNEIFEDITKNLSIKSLDSIVKISTEKSKYIEKPVENNEKTIEKIQKNGIGLARKKEERSLMIVKSNGREAQYAQLLFQLIGERSDYESIQIVSEAEYKASSLESGNTSNEKVIFFGNGKEAVIQGKAVNWQYIRFGMRYGWLGNRCVITADPFSISLNEQNAFAEYYNSRIEDFHQIIKLQHIHYTEIKSHNGILDVGGNIRATIERTEIWKHQYELLVCEYILNGFTNFLNNNIEKDETRKVVIVYDPKDLEYAHLLNNLIQQYSGYDVVEYTEKMFIECSKNLSSKIKIIFLGKTKSSKERWLDINRYIYYKNGMRYGWSGNHAFVYAKYLEKAEIEDFKEEYCRKSKEFEDKAKDYTENQYERLAYAGGLAIGLFGLPSLNLPALIANAALYTVVAQAHNAANMKKDLLEYQYHLLLREFVFNGLEKFMEET